jgi:excisionase family DNA binding protein
MSEDPVLTAHEVAEEIGVHYQTVRVYIRTGELKAAKRGNRWFIRRSWLEEFLAPTRTDVA